ncbi:unnamed protein product, partial [Phaeothamnion confervicola]
VRSDRGVDVLKGRLSMPTASPFVWAVRGMNAERVLASPSGTTLTAGGRLVPIYVPPSALKYELPSAGRPEVAFCGRSNAGKSTLIGALFGDASLVRTSKAPGCTTSLNFYALSPAGGSRAARYFLVDMPGYGFAQRAKEATRQWTRAVTGYLLGRESSVLRRTFVLVDARRGIGGSDAAMMRLLDDAGVPYQVVLTKADQLQPWEATRAAEAAMHVVVNHPACLPVLHLVSGRDGRGVRELLDTIHYIIGT